MPDDAPDIDLLHEARIYAVLTRKPDEFLDVAERSRAIGRQLLNGMVGMRPEGLDFKQAVEAELESVRAERREKAGSFPVLVMVANGEIEAELKEPYRQVNGYVVAFNVVRRDVIRERHRPTMQAMQLAVAFESELPSKLDPLVDGTGLLDEDGRTIYSFSFSSSSEGASATSLSAEGVDRMRARFRAVQESSELESVYRLAAQMMDYRTDRLRAFLSGWAAFEILISKSFRLHEEAFLAPLSVGSLSGMRGKFVERLKGVMKDKYRLADKFVAIASVVMDGKEDAEIQEDLRTFNKLKEIRDSIYHGNPFRDDGLPVYELASLLRRYFLAHINAVAALKNTDSK